MAIVEAIEQENATPTTRSARLWLQAEAASASSSDLV